jgi:hypothetical protein
MPKLDYTEEDLNIPDGGNTIWPRSDVGKGLIGLPSSQNHYEMAGLVDRPDKMVDELHNDIVRTKKYKLLSRAKVNFNWNFQPVPKPMEVDVLSCDDFGYGIRLVAIFANKEMMTISPVFVGESTVPMLIQDIHPDGGYEIDLIGRIKACAAGDAYSLAVAIPNLVQFGGPAQIQPKDIFIVHMSGMIQAANITPFVSRKVKANLPGGPQEFEAGKIGFFFPIMTNTPDGKIMAHFNAPYHIVEGNVGSVSEFRNPITGIDMVWMYVEGGTTNIELIGNKKFIHGKKPEVGDRIEARFWTQGWIHKHISRRK